MLPRSDHPEREAPWSRLLFEALDAASPLSAVAWDAVQISARSVRYASGQFFCREGDRLGDIGFIVSGLFRGYYLSADGREWNKHFDQRGAFVAASVAPTTRGRHWQQCLEPGTVVHLPFRLFEEHDPLRAAFLAFLQRAIHRKQRRELQLLSNRGAENYRAFLREYRDIEQRIPKHHVASYLGVTPTQLSRIRRSMRARHR